MKVKYDDEFTPLRNEHHGYTFTPSGYGNPACSGQKNDRKRYEFQHLRMQCNQKCVTQWRNMSAATKTAWETFAATYPQPTKADPNVFLSGYQLFVKRNFYKFLHDGIDSDFILEPELSELPDPDFSAEINDNGMCLDVTEWFIKNFGVLPEVGQYLICRIVPMAVESGQFFAPFIATLEVEEVFIDGLFLSLVFNGHTPGVVYSVYLSRPVHAGRSYPHTKFRYMGCFKPTQFIQLTDTPDSYEGQAGKFVAVKETEDGLEFVEGGGGGVTCDDVCECACIQAMKDEIDAIGETVSQEFDTSIPAVKYGLFYNGYCMVAGVWDNIIRPGWGLWVYSEFLAWEAAIEADPDQAGQLKEIGLTWWDAPNTGATNALKFNARGAGNRGSNGAYSGRGLNQAFWYREGTGGYTNYWILANTNQVIARGAHTVNYGHSLRPRKDATTLADGETGTYIGNNGRIYRTICIKGVEILADNLAETKYNDGSDIPVVTDSAAWAALTTPAMSPPDNDWDLV